MSNLILFNRNFLYQIIRYQMLFTLLAFLILGLVLAGAYFVWYRPKSQIQSFSLMAKKAGYKVKTEPYEFMSFFYLKWVLKDNRSLQYFKEDLKDYDLIVGNMFTHLGILPVHPNILKDLFNQSSKIHKNKFFAEVFNILKGGGIAFAQGEVWKRKRRIMSSVFHFDFLNEMIPTIQSQIDQELAQVDIRIKKGEKINLFKSFSKILSTVILKCFFGASVSDQKIEGKTYCQALIELVDYMIQYAQSYEHMIFGMTFYNLKLSEKSRQLRKRVELMSQIAQDAIQREIQKIKNHQKSNKNILSTLYSSNLLCEKDQTDPQKFTIDDLIAEFYIFFIAGTDTTSNATNVMLHYLSQYPQYTQKIREELQDLNKKEFPNPAEKLKNMKWIEAIFTETLRINGPAAEMIPRFAHEKISAGGLQIPKDTSLIFYPLLSQYKDQVFNKPFDFVPERWLQNPTVKPYTFIPFGAGERNCIGQHLAKIQAKILISKIVQKYKFKAIHPIKMKSEFVYRNLNEEFEMEIIQ